MRGTTLVAWPGLFAVVLLGWASSAAGELRFEDGRWRLELTGTAGIYSGPAERDGDLSCTGSVEYEVPSDGRLTLGLRLFPLFLYDDHGRDTAFGGGFGIAGRVYEHPEQHTGWFGEVSTAAILHSPRIESNSSNLNFLNELGVGYQFPQDWHLALKFQHISNAGLAEHNSGANTLGLGVGYRF